MKIRFAYFLYTLIFYLLLLSNLNTKFLFLAFLLYLLFLHWLNRNLRLSLFLAYLGSLPFPFGKTFITQFIPAQFLFIPLRTEDLAAIFVFSIKDLFILGMFLLTLRDSLVDRKNYFYPDRLSLLLFFYFLSTLIATALGSIAPKVSLLFCFYALEPLFLYYFVRRLILAKQSVLGPALAIIAAGIFLEFFQSVKQLFTGLPINQSLQQTFGSSIETDKELGNFYFRPSGTFSFPTQLTHYMISYGLIFIPSLFVTAKSSRIFQAWVFPLSFLFAMFTTILTLSRGGWVSMGASLGLWFFITRGVWRQKIRISENFKKFFYLTAPILLVSLFLFVFPRLISTYNFWGASDSGLTTRLKQLKISWSIFTNHPLFGVGLETDTLFSYLVSKDPLVNIFRWFPEPVHNYYLRLLVQVGIFPLVFLTMIHAILLYRLFNTLRRLDSPKHKTLLLGLILTFWALYNYANIQPVLGLEYFIFMTLLFTDKINLYSV